jgi:hypothetical protein
MKLTAEISAQMARNRHENWDILLQRWATILKNSEDYDVKKDHGQIQANAADAFSSRYRNERVLQMWQSGTSCERLQS